MHPADELRARRLTNPVFSNQLGSTISDNDVLTRYLDFPKMAVGAAPYPGDRTAIIWEDGQVLLVKNPTVLQPDVAGRFIAQLRGADAGARATKAALNALDAPNKSGHTWVAGLMGEDAPARERKPTLKEQRAVSPEEVQMLVEMDEARSMFEEAKS